MNSGEARKVKSKHEADIVSHNSELLKCIDDMKMKRDEIQLTLMTLGEEQRRLQKDLLLLTTRLSTVNENICRNMLQMDKYDLMIKAFRDEFINILQGSENLLENIKEAVATIKSVNMNENSDSDTLTDDC